MPQRKYTLILLLSLVAVAAILPAAIHIEPHSKGGMVVLMLLLIIPASCAVASGLILAVQSQNQRNRARQAASDLESLPYRWVSAGMPE